MIPKLFKSQQKFITKEFGKEASENANYGWVSGDDSYLTKVYGQQGKFPTMIVSTFVNDEGKIVHDINHY